MRHLNQYRKLNRTASHRKALLKNMMCSLIEHEQIITTLPKAKTLRPVIEKIVTKSKNPILARKRLVNSILRNPRAEKKLFDTLGPRYKTRNGGYTRIIKMPPRYGDNTSMAVIEFVDRDIYAKGKNDLARVANLKKSEDSEKKSA